MECSGALGLPEWLEIGNPTDIELKYMALPAVSRDGRLTWLMQFVNRERPLLNYQNAA
jgi:hypothetical protein